MSEQQPIMDNANEEVIAITKQLLAKFRRAHPFIFDFYRRHREYQKDLLVDFYEEANEIFKLKEERIILQWLKPLRILRN